MTKIEQTLNSQEVAKMVRKDHAMLLRDLRRYEKQLTECNLAVSEFFNQSQYKDSTGRTLPCYLVTKKGCEFIAHKLTGTKGTEFTARYINRFHEMETALQGQEKRPLPEESLSGIGRILEVMEHTMTTQDADPRDTAKVMKSLLNQFGIRVPREFTASRPALGRCGGGRKEDIIHLIGKIDDSVFLFRIYVSLREYIKEKEAQA